MTTNTHLQLDWSVEPSVVRPVIRELLVIIGLVLGMQLGFVLPGTNHPLFDTTVTGDDIILGAGSLGIVASLVYGAPKANRLIRRVIIEPKELKENAGQIGYAFVLFIAVLIAHFGLAPLVRPVVAIPWLYDLVFLLIALVPLGIIAYRFRTMLEPLANIVTNGIIPESADTVPGLDTEPTNPKDPTE